MAGGESAAHEADRQRALADERARLEGIAHQLVRTFGAAARDERRLARTLIELEPLGWTLLADRRWPGSAQNVDLVLVGPAGVVIVDAQDGRDVRVDADSVRRGDVDVTDEIARIADLVYRLQKLLAEVGLAPGEVSGVVAFSGAPVPTARLFGLTLLGEAAAVTEIARRGRRLDARRVAELRTVVERLLPPPRRRGIFLPGSKRRSPTRTQSTRRSPRRGSPKRRSSTSPSSRRR
ncbi:hypothetical protein GCM10025881_32000 [Pseudolysinimonas kribbensis]|uniref:NERD domain-containing protein n=1 Tax=Pseudolysinimonas kribbensis TaxID=433641 RepID=A0ABQ6K9I9_9MICO|nr:nuclease-related domain-containing protein [Pseudolysinimonas kribbensis]GMA96376.1 hypothetical protein GCM10025881_32000 [Pseudolysinimonas kribbensis]